jgi:hypothetical protein
MIKQLLLAATALMLVVPSAVQAKVKADTTFTFPKDKPVKIIVFRPDVQVGSLGVGGVAEPNAEWTATARTNLAEALKANQQARDNEVVFLTDQQGESAQTVADYQALFRAVAASVVQHKFFGAKLPTKKDKFDWTLGPGAAKLGEIGGGNYALFLYTKDDYGTAGRKVAQVFAAAMFGAYVPAGVHISYAALADLENGNIVWFNVDPASGGDPRETDGATKRIGQILKTLPLKEGQAPVVTKKK